MPSHNLKLQMLFEFWEKYHKQPQQMAKWCPFNKHYGETACGELCYTFDLLYAENGDCPCRAFGTEGALQRLEEVLRDGGYYLDMREKTRVRTIVPCKECHEYPCTCELLGPTKE